MLVLAFPKRIRVARAIHVALEEHFPLPETDVDSIVGYARSTPELRLQTKDMGGGRIAEMDRGAVELCILSLVSPGIQAIPSVAQAIAMWRRSNDHQAEHIAKYPKRLKGFAALPLQDPQAAAQELTRCVKERRVGQWILTDQRSGFGGVL